MNINTNNYMAKIAMEKSILKEFSNNSNERLVYLNNGNEFQIQLFNPEAFTVGAEIYINGQKLPGIIVIRPGERHWIERPTDSNKKFKFETYEVEDSEEVANAIAKNGLISVKFYKESSYRPVTYVTNSTPYPTFNCPATYHTGDFIERNVMLTSAVNNTDCVRSKSVCSHSLANNAVLSKSCSNSILDLDVVKGIDTNNNVLKVDACDNNIMSLGMAPEIAKMETGRITSGSHSDQTFKSVDIEFEYWSYKTEIIKILPMSRKPFTSSDLQKIYCTNCGRKLNPKFKYCPYCGTKCDQFFENDNE